MGTKGRHSRPLLLVEVLATITTTTTTTTTMTTTMSMMALVTSLLLLSTLRALTTSSSHRLCRCSAKVCPKRRSTRNKKQTIEHLPRCTSASRQSTACNDRSSLLAVCQSLRAAIMRLSHFCVAFANKPTSRDFLDKRLICSSSKQCSNEILVKLEREIF